MATLLTVATTINVRGSDARRYTTTEKTISFTPTGMEWLFNSSSLTGASDANIKAALESFGLWIEYCHANDKLFYSDNVKRYGCTSLKRRTPTSVVICTHEGYIEE